MVFYLGSSENITVLRSMLNQVYKSFVMTGRIPRERVLSNGLMIRRGYTSEHYVGAIIIYGNYHI